MNMIVAADSKWGIGRDNGLLASLPSDMKYFREHKIRTLFGVVTKLSKEKRFINVKGDMIRFEEMIEIEL